MADGLEFALGVLKLRQQQVELEQQADLQKQQMALRQREVETDEAKAAEGRNKDHKLEVEYYSGALNNLVEGHHDNAAFPSWFPLTGLKGLKGPDGKPVEFVSTPMDGGKMIQVRRTDNIAAVTAMRESQAKLGDVQARMQLHQAQTELAQAKGAEQTLKAHALILAGGVSPEDERTMELHNERIEKSRSEKVKLAAISSDPAEAERALHDPNYGYSEQELKLKELYGAYRLTKTTLNAQAIRDASNGMPASTRDYMKNYGSAQILQMHGLLESLGKPPAGTTAPSAPVKPAAPPKEERARQILRDLKSGKLTLDQAREERRKLDQQ